MTQLDDVEERHISHCSPSPTSQRGVKMQGEAEKRREEKGQGEPLVPAESCEIAEDFLA